MLWRGLGVEMMEKIMKFQRSEVVFCKNTTQLLQLHAVLDSLFAIRADTSS